MNERINGLWWKAQIGYNNQNCDPEVLEKFAELIVFKCIDLCNETYFKNYSDAEHWEESEEGRVIREYFVGEK